MTFFFLFNFYAEIKLFIKLLWYYFINLLNGMHIEKKHQLVNIANWQLNMMLIK